MFIKGTDMSEVLRKEQEYIDSLRARWGGVELLPDAEQALRMGKRSELLGDLECQQRREATTKAEEVDEMSAASRVSLSAAIGEYKQIARECGVDEGVDLPVVAMAFVHGAAYGAKQPTLTDEEREAISAAACICEDAGRTDIAVIINTALSRLF